MKRVGIIVFCLVMICAWATWRFYDATHDEVAPGPEVDVNRDADLPRRVKISIDNAGEFDLAYMPPGEFEMGKDAYSLFNPFGQSSIANAHPPHPVTLTNGYYIGRRKISSNQYCRFLNSFGDKLPNQYIELGTKSGNASERAADSNISMDKAGVYQPRERSNPVESGDQWYHHLPQNVAANTVPWPGAEAYCEWWKEQTGIHARLPTEAEWEYAARGPGNQYDEIRSSAPGWQTYTQYPGDKFVTPAGVQGLNSYIGDWVSDYYGPYPSERQVDPRGVDSNQNGNRVLRRARSGDIVQRDGSYKADQGTIYAFRIVIAAESIRTALHDQEALPEGVRIDETW